MTGLLTITESGLYCAAGNFHIDPWRPVDLAVTTHAHSDHARWGSRTYLCAERGRGVLEARLGSQARIQTVRFGETIHRDGVQLSLHPAGHVLGSAQVRVEYRGEVWVVSGDYKTVPDGICEGFEPVRCDTFVTESTFGLPIYRWPAAQEVFADLNSWWRRNQEQGRSSVLFCYALGKAQRLLAGCDPSIGPIFLHGAIERFLPAYRAAGVRFPPIESSAPEKVRALNGRALILAPTSADNSPWLRKFGEVSTAFASGWMQIRGTRRRRSLDRGFVLSDHPDWEGLIGAIRSTGARKIKVTHGYTQSMARWLRENGWEAEALKTRFEGEVDDEAEVLPAADEAPNPNPDLIQ